MTDVKITLLPGDGPAYARTEVEINGVRCDDVQAFNLNRTVDKPDRLTLTLDNPNIVFNHVFNHVEVGVSNTWKEHFEEQR